MSIPQQHAFLACITPYGCRTASVSVCTGLLAEYVDAVKLAMELDIIIKCKTAGDYSLASSTDSATPVSGFTKTWRMYRYCTHAHGFFLSLLTVLLDGPLMGCRFIFLELLNANASGSS